LTTQLIGALQYTEKDCATEIEFATRVLAQGIVNDGTLWVWSSSALLGIVPEVLDGENALPNTALLTDTSQISSVDRVLLITHSTSDEDFLHILTALPNNSSVAIISGDELVGHSADACIVLTRNKGMLPLEDGERICSPFSILVLYVLLIIKAQLHETLEDFYFEIEATPEDE
ncbi:MAG: DUF2529 family protein, partial [Bacilli bacterium]